MIHVLKYVNTARDERLLVELDSVQFVKFTLVFKKKEK